MSSHLPMKATSYISSNYIFLFYAVHFIHDLLYMTAKYYSISLDVLIRILYRFDKHLISMSSAKKSKKYGYIIVNLAQHHQRFAFITIYVYLIPLFMKYIRAYWSCLDMKRCLCSVPICFVCLMICNTCTYLFCWYCLI